MNSRSNWRRASRRLPVGPCRRTIKLKLGEHIFLTDRL